jgi:hypothetical protein
MRKVNLAEKFWSLDGRSRGQVIHIGNLNRGHISQSMAAEEPSKYRTKKKGKK